MCILLVVLWHVIAKQYLRIEWPEGLRIPGAWGTMGELLLPLRMPLFFTISGMFALNAVNRPWSLSARPRVGKFLYLYALWLLIHTAILSLTPEFPTDRAITPLGLLEQLTITPSNLWYLYALAVYFVIAKVTRRFPRLVVLAFAVALSIVAAAELIPVPGNRAGLLQNLVWFLAGLYFRPAVERLAASANWPRLIIATVVYAAALLAVAATGAQDIPGVWPAVCVTAVVFGVVGAAMLSRWNLLAKPLTSIGRRTLPIYVMHMPLLALLDQLLATPLSAVKQPAATVLAVVEPILLTAFLAWVCLTLHRLMERENIDQLLLNLPSGQDRAPAQSTPPAPVAAAPAPVLAYAGAPSGYGVTHAYGGTDAAPSPQATLPGHAAGYGDVNGAPSVQPAWSPAPSLPHGSPQPEHTAMPYGGAEGAPAAQPGWFPQPGHSQAEQSAPPAYGAPDANSAVQPAWSPQPEPAQTPRQGEHAAASPAYGPPDAGPAVQPAWSPHPEHSQPSHQAEHAATSPAYGPPDAGPAVQPGRPAQALHQPEGSAAAPVPDLSFDNQVTAPLHAPGSQAQDAAHAQARSFPDQHVGSATPERSFDYLDQGTARLTAPRDQAEPSANHFEALGRSAPPADQHPPRQAVEWPTILEPSASAAEGRSPASSTDEWLWFMGGTKQPTHTDHPPHDQSR